MGERKRPNNGPASGIPARGGGPAGSWPPFQLGHEINLRHGARSDRHVEPLAKAFTDVLLADRPDLAAYPEAVVAWATAEARCEKYRQWHAEVGFFDADGNVRGGPFVLAYERLAQQFRERLGLDPLADAALAKSRAEAVLTAVDLESIRARGREAFARRQRAELATAGSDVVEADVDDGD
jgi:hypothetical protein